MVHISYQLRRMKNIFILFSFFLLTLSYSFAQEKEKFSFDLKQSVEYALKNHGRILNAAIDEQSAREKVREISGIGFPQVNAGLDFKDFVELPTSLIPAEFFGGQPGTYFPVKFGTRYNMTASVDASQIVFD